MNAEATEADLRAKIAELERELGRVKRQRNKAWCDRAEIHARLRAMTWGEKQGIRNPEPRDEKPVENES